MKYSQSVSARQFAKAFFKEFGQTLTLSDIENIAKSLQFFKKHHNFLSLVSILMSSHHGIDYQDTIIQDLFDHFQWPTTLKKLITLLLEHKKLNLFASVLQDLCCLFYVKNNILELTVSSAVPLDPETLQKFEQFFIKLSKKKIITTVVHDSSLIAGVHLQSDLFMWQYSIAARLAALQQNILIKGLT
jgi:F0F1-type ATP synthase delta subunit